MISIKQLNLIKIMPRPIIVEVSSSFRSGILFKELDKIDEAFKDYNKAIELNPKNVNSLYNRGIRI